MQLNLFAAEVECTDQEGVTRNTIAYRSFHAFLAILLTLSMTGVLRAQPQTAKVIVNIAGVRNATGRVEVRLWNGKEGFPKDDTKAFRRTTVKIVNGRFTRRYREAVDNVSLERVDHYDLVGVLQRLVDQACSLIDLGELRTAAQRDRVCLIESASRN